MRDEKLWNQIERGVQQLLNHPRAIGGEWYLWRAVSELDKRLAKIEADHAPEN